MLQTIAFFLVLVSCYPVKMQKYIGKEYEIAYPENWYKQDNSNAVFFVSPMESSRDLFKENVNIILQDLSKQPMTLEEYTQLSKKQVSDAYGSSAIISIKNKKVAGQPAKEMVFRRTYQAGYLKLKQYWFIKGHYAYLFTYTADESSYANYQSLINEMVDSFKLR